MRNPPPACIVLTAISEENPDEKVVEKFHLSTYMDATDRHTEAMAFANRMIDRGFYVEYSEHEELMRI